MGTTKSIPAEGAVDAKARKPKGGASSVCSLCCTCYEADLTAHHGV